MNHHDFAARAKALAFFSLSVFACTSAAQDITIPNEYGKVVKSAEAVGALGTDLFGDQTSFYTGSTEFTVTDVSVPGKGSIPVRVGRRFLVEDKTGVYGGVNGARPSYQFGDWQMDIPHLHGVFVRQWGWISSYQPSTQRCLNINNPAAVAPPGVITEGTAFAASEYWHGNQLYVPGAGDQEMLVVMPDNPQKPTAGGDYRWVTQQQWYFSCLPSMAPNNGTAGDAFLARAPDGTRYWFDWAVAYPAPRITKPAGMGPISATSAESTEQSPLPVTSTDEMSSRSFNGVVLNRDEVWIYPTRIEDRFGNWVTYTYDTTYKHRLTHIAASDGRSITLNYNTDGQVQSVSDGTRTWIYAYSGGILLSVTLPDASQWRYSLASLDLLHPADDMAEPSCGGLPSNPVQTALSGSITHPSGAVGTFTFKPTLHGRSYVDRNCPGVITPNGAVYLAVHPNLYDSISIQSKRITGPGIAPYQWDFAYGPPNESWLQDCGNCTTTKTVTATGPGEWIRYTFSNRFRSGEGKLLKTETGTGPTNILRTEMTGYQIDPAGQPYPARIGVTPFTRSDRTSEKHAPQTYRQIVQQGVTFTWQANSFDVFANPLSTTRYSTLGYTRTDVTAYHHDYSQWVIGQVASSTNTDSGLIESQTDYWPATALPQRTWSFGKAQQYLVYNADGTLASVTDGNNHTTSFASWKRGIPQSVTFADAKSQSAIVDDVGRITAVTNETGAKTCYGYDPMGRMTSITYPSETQLGVCDTSTWLPTIFSFAPAASAVYGLPAGHWQQRVTTGNARTVTVFDALWRPVVKETSDLTNVAGTIAQTVTRYDADGRAIYTSYPQRTLNPAIYNTWGDPSVAPNALGSRTAYDALGRPVEGKQDSEYGPLISTTEYLSAFQTRTTTPGGSQTTTGYMAYDQPSNDLPHTIAHPEGAYTDITRDLFGKPRWLTRRNASSTLAATRTYVYDAYQQLCKTIDPETGSTAMGYDNAGNLAWSAAGLALPSSKCDAASVPVTALVSRTYDARDRIQTLAFPDGQGSQIWTYTADGLPEQVTTQNSGVPAVNTYTYNRRRLMTSEGIAQSPGYSWGIGYGFNVYGHRTVVQYPNGQVLNLTPNALGQTVQASSPGQDYATAVSYYPNGAIEQFTYGNGLLHRMLQNERQLPDVSCDFLGTCNASAVLNDGYDYDLHGNVRSISDGTAGNRGNRNMTYDGLDRLKYVASPMYGTVGANYSYDVLDNLTRVNIGGTAARDHYYCYDAQWRLTNVKTGSCNGTSVIGLGYDAQGNLANKNGQAYVFDTGNRLRQATGLETYRYDAHGRRIQATTTQPILSQYTANGTLLYQQDDRRGLNLNYVHLGGSLIAIREQPTLGGAVTVKYQHTDALGTPTAVTDANRVVIEKSEYEPYGGLLNRPLKDGPGYTGHVSDAATGLSYMQQRYYDPMLAGGRFLSVDPVTADSVGGNFNRYWYANNNPYKYTDPDGRIVLNIAGGIIGGIVGGVGGAVVTAISGGSKREIAASAIGGIVGGAITGASFGTGASLGAIAAAGVTGGILGESTSQTVENVAKHGSDMSSYSYSIPKIAVSGLMGATDGVTGGLVSEVAGPALKESTKAFVTEGGLLPFKTVTEILIRSEEGKRPPQSEKPGSAKQPRIPADRMQKRN